MKDNVAVGSLDFNVAYLMMIPVEFTTTNVFIADIAMPCQLYYSLLVYLLSFYWLLTILENALSVLKAAG